METTDFVKPICMWRSKKEVIDFNKNNGIVSSLTFNMYLKYNHKIIGSRLASN